MQKLARWRWAAFSAVLLGASCTNDYEQFDFSGAHPSFSDGQAGTAGAAQGSGGQLGSGPDASTGGTGGAGTGGTAGDGGSGAEGDAQGGTAGGGTGGAGGLCGQFDLFCSGSCVDGRGRANCGACGNDCEQQGISTSTRFQCIDMLCGCTSSLQCGSSRGASCSMLAARCICNTIQCQAGERCSMTSGNCTCNAGPACSQGQICCVNGGCRTSC